jgi:hypothetical protein
MVRARLGGDSLDEHISGLRPLLAHRDPPRLAFATKRGSSRLGRYLAEAPRPGRKALPYRRPLLRHPANDGPDYYYRFQLVRSPFDPSLHGQAVFSVTEDHPSITGSKSSITETF